MITRFARLCYLMSPGFERTPKPLYFPATTTHDPAELAVPDDILGFLIESWEVEAVLYDPRRETKERQRRSAQFLATRRKGDPGPAHFSKSRGSLSRLFHSRTVLEVNRNFRRMQQGVVNQAVMHGLLDAFEMFGL